MQSERVLSTNVRRAYGVLAGILWFGVALSFLLAVLHTYPSMEKDPNLLAFSDASALDRVIDLASYFTIWSNALAAFVLTRLALGRWTGSDRERLLRSDSVLMMSISGIVYAYLLAGRIELQGLQHLTNGIQHYWGPGLVAGTWAVWGPRGWFRPTHLVTALGIPIAWLIYSLARGAYMRAYPYPFLDVTTYGYGGVFTTVAQIIAFGVVLGAVFLALDRFLGRRDAGG